LLVSSAIPAVSGDEITEEFVVKCVVSRVRVEARFHRDAVGHLIDSDAFQRGRLEQRCLTGIRVHRIFDDVDPPVEDVGEDVGSDLRSVAVADESDRPETLPGEPLGNLE
jgi:hypothetical protein